MTRFASFSCVLLLIASAAAGAEEADLETARNHLQHGRYAEALEDWDELARSSEKHALAVALGRSRTLEAQGQWTEAIAAIRDALEEKADDPALLARLAELTFHRGEYAAAEEHARAAIKADADQPLARLILADVLTETGRLEEADEAYRWSIRYYNRVQPKDAETLVLVGRGSVQYARWHANSQIFNFVVNTLCPDALKADEHCWQARQLGGSLLLEKYNRPQALPEFQAALAINPRSADALASLAEAAAQQNDWEETRQHADKALEVDPQFVPALQLKADARLYEGDPAAALALLEQALAVNPHDQRTLARVAACYLAIDGLPAPERFDELLKQSESAEPRLDEPNRFERLVLDLFKRNPHPGEFLTLLAERLEARRQYPVAEVLYATAIRTMPQLPQPKTALGMLSMRMGNIEAAREILDTAFSADPYHVRVSNMRKVIRVLDGYDTVTTDHFVIHVDSQFDRLLGQYMAEYLEDIYDDLVKQYGYEPPERTHIEIYNDARGLKAHEWFSARMIGLPWLHTVGASTGAVVALASPTATPEPFNWARVLRHEFVHVITLQQTNYNVPHWFTEALAVLSEGYPRPPKWDELLLERVPKGDLRNLDTINQGFTRAESQLDWQFAYCQSRLYAEYMIETHGADSIPKMLDAYRRGLNTERAIAEACGVDKREFEEGYRKYLDETVSKIAGRKPLPERTIVELQQAHEANPDDPQAAGEYAYALLKRRRGDAARKLAEQALEKNPKEPSAGLVLAHIALANRDSGEARERLEAALVHDEPDSRVLLLLASLRYRAKENDEAKELFSLGRREFPYDSSWLQGLAATAVASGDKAAAREHLQTLAAMDPDDAGFRKKLAELAVADSDWEAARRQAISALQIDVLDADLHRMLADAYRGLNQIERAIAEYGAALELNPGDAELEQALAEALADTAKPAEPE